MATICTVCKGKLHEIVPMITYPNLESKPRKVTEKLPFLLLEKESAYHGEWCREMAALHLAVLCVQRRGCGTCIKAVRLLNLLNVNEMLSFQNSAYLFAVFLHEWPNIPVSTLSAVCGDDLLGDGGHVPRYYQRDDVSHWESRPAYRGISELQKGMALICSISFLEWLLHTTGVHQLRALWVCVYVHTLHSYMCVILSSGRDHSQHLQQYCESGPYPVDGPGLHCISWAAH